ncbi:MAG: phosphoglucomutase, alpha-D-glucose phosphate-specific [Candidatus Anammoxibacter sp.]
MAKIHKLAGQRPEPNTLVKREEIEKLYFKPNGTLKPVKNGTSGHRGNTGTGFSDLHVAAMTQALVDIRKERGTFGPDLHSTSDQELGPIIMGKDVRFTSDLAQRTAAEVFAGNGMAVVIQKWNRSTPTPVISHQIINRNTKGGNVEGVIITASHNPPTDAGYKSNGLDGGPNTRTKPIDDLANRYIQNASEIKRKDFDKAVLNGMIAEEDMVTPYVNDLSNVVRMDIIKGARFAATPLGGSAHGYYEAVNNAYDTKIDIVLSEPDPASAKRTYDWDGKLRGDPSSKYVMKAVQGYLQKMDVPFIGANDNDADRFGGEDATGILNPNHVLCVVFDYLAKNRGFDPKMGVGRTIGTTHMLDLIAANYKRPVYEVNVGFKWYVEGLKNRKYVIAGEESAGFSLPRLDGSLWVTEKDGIAAVLLMMEIIASTGDDIGTLYSKLVTKYGPHQYERVDTTATASKKSRLTELASNPDEVKSLLSNKKIAGFEIKRLVIGDGIKVVLENDTWVLKRASGTEDIIKDYREERGEGLKIARKASEEIDNILKLVP